MRRHWKAILWLSIIVLLVAIAAFASRSYVLAIALAYATAIIAFVLGAAWMREARPGRH